MKPTQEQIDDARMLAKSLRRNAPARTGVIDHFDALLVLDAAYRAKCEELEAMKSKELAMWSDVKHMMVRLMKIGLITHMDWFLTWYPKLAERLVAEENENPRL